MTVVSVRNVVFEDGWSPPEIKESDTLAIRFEGASDVVGRFEEYPYNGQTVYTYKYKYTPDKHIDSPIKTAGFGGQDEYDGPHKYISKKGSKPFDVEGEFQIREKSGMLFLETEGERSQGIFEALDDVLGRQIKIEPRFVPQRQQVWNFIANADSLERVEVLTPKGEVSPISEIGISWENIQEYPVETAYLLFRYDNNKFNIQYSDDTFTIDTEDRPAREYFIQLFELSIHDAALQRQ